jgi:colicin import membrane protein
VSTPGGGERPAQPGRLRAIALAVLVHGLFFALIFFGVSWQSKPTAPLMAELWDKLPVGKPTPPKPAPEQEPPKPEVAPEPPKPEPSLPKPEPLPPKPEVKPEPPKPDIALKQKLEKEKLERQKRDEEKKQEELKKKREQEKADADRKKKDDERRKAEERLKSETATAEARKAEAARSAQQSIIDEYKGKIVAKIRSRSNIPDNVSGRPKAEFKLTLLPTGEVLFATLVKSSGNRAYDEALERGIRSAQPLPLPPNPELFPQFRELNLIIEHER